MSKQGKFIGVFFESPLEGWPPQFVPHAVTSSDEADRQIDTATARIAYLRDMAAVVVENDALGWTEDGRAMMRATYTRQIAELEAYIDSLRAQWSYPELRAVLDGLDPQSDEHALLAMLIAGGLCAAKQDVVQRLGLGSDFQGKLKQLVWRTDKRVKHLGSVSSTRNGFIVCNLKKIPNS